VTGGQLVRFVVKVIWEDFAWFILIFHLSDHLVEDQDGIGVVGLLVPGHCLLLGERCHLQ
jgi:hypothetical protein